MPPQDTPIQSLNKQFKTVKAMSEDTGGLSETMFIIEQSSSNESFIFVESDGQSHIVALMKNKSIEMKK